MSQLRSASRAIHGMRTKVAGPLRPSGPVCTKVTKGAPVGTASTVPGRP